MHDRHDHDRMNSDASLAAALRALPASTPPNDTWPLLAARARRRRRMALGLKAGIPAALAAGIALALLLPSRSGPGKPPAVRPAVASVSASTSTADLAKLQSRSQHLEALVRRLNANGAPLDGRSLAGAIELQDRIGLIDLQLTVAHQTRAQVPLWRHRIMLLRQLALLHLTAGNDYARAARNPRTAVHDAAWNH